MTAKTQGRSARTALGRFLPAMTVGELCSWTACYAGSNGRVCPATDVHCSAGFAQRRSVSIWPFSTSSFPKWMVCEIYFICYTRRFVLLGCACSDSFLVRLVSGVLLSTWRLRAWHRGCANQYFSLRLDSRPNCSHRWWIDIRLFLLDQDEVSSGDLNVTINDHTCPQY